METYVKLTGYFSCVAKDLAWDPAFKKQISCLYTRINISINVSQTSDWDVWFI